MNFFSALASLCLVALSKCTVTPTSTVFNLTNYREDLIQLNMTQLFNLDGSKNPQCQVYQSAGAIYNATTPIATKNYSQQGYGDIAEVFNFVSNTTAFGVFDDSQVMVQNITLDAESFSGVVYFGFNRVGANAVCTDVELNPKLNRLYVACITKPQSSRRNGLAQTPSSVWLIELDATSGTEYNRIMVNQDANHTFTHRAQITLMYIRPYDHRGDVTLYVFVYDQGISSAYTTSNQFALVFGNGDSGNLTSLGYADITGVNLNAVYDYFNYEGEVLVTGKNISNFNAPIVIGFCGFTFSQSLPVINCSSNLIPSPFNTTIGYVGIMNTRQYVEVNANNNNTNATGDYIYICNFAGPFGTPNFIDTQNCNPIATFAIPNDVGVQIVEGNIHQVVIKYTHFDSTYAGFSLHNFDLKFERNHIDDSQAPQVVPIGKSIVGFGQSIAEIHRIVPPYYFVAGTDLHNSINNIRIDCTDDDTQTPVSKFVTINMMQSMRDLVMTTNSSIPELATYETGDIVLGVDPHTVMGNDLKLTVTTSASQYVNYTKTQVYDTEFINVDFKFDKGSSAFIDIHFVGRYAVAIDNRNWVIFMVCNFTSWSSLFCVETQAYSLAGHDVRLQKDLNIAFGWVFSWATDSTSNITHTFIFDPSANTLNHYFFGGVATDATMAESEGYAYMVLSYYDGNTFSGRVEGYEFYPNNPSSFTKVPTITRGLSAREYFCPVDLDFDPIDEDIIEILSICPGKDQRILRYRYPPTQSRQTGGLVLNLLSTVPINFAFQNPAYCSMGTEFVIYSMLNGKTPNLQSANTYDDRNQWMFGTTMDDLNLGTIQKFNCIARSGVFVTTSIDSNQNTILTIYWGNNQWQANHKVFNTLRQGLNNFKFIDSYEFMGNVIHTAWNQGGQYSFLLSFSREVYVDIQFLKGIGNATVPLDFRYTNGAGRVVITKQVSVVTANTTATVKTLQKMNGTPTGTLNLEDYVQINGPLEDAFLHYTGGDHNAVRLVGRVRTIRPYFPAPDNRQTIRILETYFNITIGLHRAPSNASILTLFQNNDEFWGTYQSPVGVNAYHFAPMVNSDNRTVLIAYSTAEPAHASLQFLALQEGQRVGIGYLNDSITRNYDQIRVVPIGPQGSNIFLVFGKYHAEQSLHVFRVQFQNGQITSSLMDDIPDVHDFTWVMPDQSNQVYLWYITDSDRTNIMYQTYGRLNAERINGPAQKLNIKKVFKNKLGNTFENYDVISIVGKQHNSTAYYLVLNAFSNTIYEIVIDINAAAPLTYVYWKVENYDGYIVDGNKHHIAVMSRNMRSEGGARLVIFKRQINGGGPNVYWIYHNDEFRSFTLTDCPQNMSHLQVATPFENAPVFFLEVQRMQLQIQDGADLTKASLELISAAQSQAAQFNLSQIINGGGSDTGKSTKWWPFVLIIGLLVLLAVGFIAFKMLKDRKDQSSDNPDNYVSLKPSGKEAAPTESAS